MICVTVSTPKKLVEHAPISAPSANKLMEHNATVLRKNLASAKTVKIEFSANLDLLDFLIL